MILDFLKSSLFCVALSLLFVSCASTPRAPESIYDETGTLVSRTTFDAKNNIETQWKAINDSTAIFESFEDGIHTIDTLATEALRISTPLLPGHARSPKGQRKSLTQPTKASRPPPKAFPRERNP